MVRLLVDVLRDQGYEAVVAGNGREAIDYVRREGVDAVVTDLRMEDVDGMDVLNAVQEIDPTIPVILMTAYAAVSDAVEAIKRGAHHYVTKPFELSEMIVHVERALADGRILKENRALRRFAQLPGPDEIVGPSEPLRHVVELIDRVAPSTSPVLIRGESGTGKELVARAIHFRGPWSSGPFVPVNCSAIPEAMLESELFGHVKGAFTSAEYPRRGLFLEADGGTLFLDEIGDMAPALQAKLLRVIEEKAVRPVGADAPRHVEVRIVAATHHDLEGRIAQGQFRQDLYFRLNVMPILVPPLRDRPEDIPVLARHFLARMKKSYPTMQVRRLSASLMSALEAHRWPGNVRELENLIERLAIVCDRAEAGVADARGLIGPAELEQRPPASSAFVAEVVKPLRELEEAYVDWVVNRCQGNKTRAAELLGIDVSTIHRRFARKARRG